MHEIRSRMKASDTFNLNRFGLLVKQNFIHNYRIMLICLAGFCGGLFMSLLFIQATNEFHTWSVNAYFSMFLTVFISTGLLYAGTAFPRLRSREKSYSYLLIPASVFEKFLFEVLTRIVLFLVLVPLLYWVIFNTEGFFLQAVHSEFAFKPYSYMDLILLNILPSELTHWLMAMSLSLGLLIFTLPFVGAATFMKYPLPKTLFGVALLFLFHALLVYFFLEVLGSDGPSDGKVLGMDGDGFIRFLTVYAIIANIVLLTASYFKLKEREA